MQILYLNSVQCTPSFSHTSMSHLFFAVRVIKLKLLRVFQERCRTKAPSTSLSPTCWLAFSTPVRTSEQRVSHSSGTNTQTDGFEEKLIQLIRIIKINGKMWCEPMCCFLSEPWCTLEIWNLKGERHRLRWRVESTACTGTETSTHTQIHAAMSLAVFVFHRLKDSHQSHTLAPGCSSAKWTFCFEASCVYPEPQECFYFFFFFVLQLRETTLLRRTHLISLKRKNPSSRHCIQWDYSPHS